MSFWVNQFRTMRTKSANRFITSGIDHPATPYLEEILEEHIPLRELRHDIVHGFWAAIGPDEEYLLKRKQRKKGEDATRTLELKELVDGWQRLDRLGSTVINASRAFEGKEIR